MKNSFRKKIHHNIRRLANIDLAKLLDESDILNFGFLNEKTIFVFTKNNFAVISLMSRKVLSKIPLKINFLIDLFIITLNKNPNKSSLRLVLVFDSCLKNSTEQGRNTCICCYDIVLTQKKDFLQSHLDCLIQHKWVYFQDPVLDKISLLSNKNLHTLKLNLNSKYDKSLKFLDIEKGEVIKLWAFEKTTKFVNEFTVLSHKKRLQILKEFFYDSRLEIQKGQNVGCSAVTIKVGADSKNGPVIDTN